MDTLTILASGGRDEFGDRSAPTETGTFVGQVAPARATEPNRIASDPSIERLEVYCPDSSVPVAHDDAVTLNDVRYRVVGAPARWGMGCVVTIERKVG